MKVFKTCRKYTSECVIVGSDPDRGTVCIYHHGNQRQSQNVANLMGYTPLSVLSDSMSPTF